MKTGMYRHGMYNTKMYCKWVNVKQRCLNPKHPSYHNYGGRGITVCDEWNDFLNFQEWATHNGYSDSLELDRIDNDGNYEPNNFRFITHRENNYNKRTNVLYTYNNETLPLRDLAAKYGINPATLRTRLFKGWGISKSLEEPIRKGGRYNEEYYK